MRLWIDGGSLHATVRCLEQRGEANDAADQLHIATQLAFADTLVVGAYGGGYYLDQTERAKQALIGIGFEQTCLDVVQASPLELEAIYLAAAESLAERLAGLFDAADFSGANFLLAESVRRSEDRFDTEVRKNLSTAERAALYEDIRSVENNGHLIMLAKSDALWEAVRRLVGDGQQWSSEHSARLASICRIYIHQAYADRRQAVYAPGRDRGAAMRRLPEFILQEVADMPGTVLDGYKLGESGLPPVAGVLAQRAKGSPRKLMEETLVVRGQAKPLRGHLRKMMAVAVRGDRRAQVIAAQDMAALTADLRESLTTRPSSVLLNAFDFFNRDGLLASALGWGTAHFLGIAKMVDAVKTLMRFRRVAVLTEMAAEIKTIGIDPTALRALQNGVSRRE